MEENCSADRAYSQNYGGKLQYQNCCCYYKPHLSHRPSVFSYLTLSLTFPSSCVFPRPSSWCPSSLPLLPGRSCLFPYEDGFLDDGHGDPSLTPGLNSPTRGQNGERMERYSRKVFVGGLPPDIDEGRGRLIFYNVRFFFFFFVCQHHSVIY